MAGDMLTVKIESRDKLLLRLSWLDESPARIKGLLISSSQIGLKQIEFSPQQVSVFRLSFNGLTNQFAVLVRSA